MQEKPSTFKFPDARILVFAKAPVSGRCKTRLIPAVGATGAARIQRRLILRTLATTTRSGLAPVSLWGSPGSTHSFLQRGRSHFGIELKSQPSGSLGKRMSYALAQTLRHARSAVLVGTDCPALNAGLVRAALRELHAGADAVFVPAEDGGYVLVGLRAPQPALFHGVDWGTSRVMTQTRRRIERLDIRAVELAPLWDVDHPADLRRAQRLGLL